MDYLSFIDEFTFDPFEDNKNVIVKDMYTGRGKSFSKEKIDEKLIDFYNKMDSFLLKWETIDDNPDNNGSINILKTNDAFIDGKDLVYFDHTPEDSALRDFYIIDFFVDEACVGIYTNHPELQGMHYFDFENETYPYTYRF